MKDILSQLHFASPLFLYLFLLLPLLWLRLRGRSFVVILWRSVIFAVLVLALADPELVTETKKTGERIFAFDLSRSIPEAMRLWMIKQKLSPAPGDRTFVFGGEVEEVDDWNRWVRGEVSNDSIKPGATNLEKLFSALSRLPSAPRNVFLFTDGWETQGELDRLIPSLGLSGLKVFPILPASRPETANVAVKKVLIPPEGNKGAAINLKAIVENQLAKEVEGKLILKRNGQPLKEETVRIKPGAQIFSYQTTLADGPLNSFSASFVPRTSSSDLFPFDNQATSWVAVQNKDKILLLNGHSGEGRYLEEILKRRGYELTSLTLNVPNRSPPSPAGYSVVIFNNVEREKFSSGYLAEIERHVAAGNGFLMLGGEASFAPGGYRQTPIETILPVELREPKKEEKNRAVVLVIDKSGSMREGNRLLYAKEAAKAVIGQLKGNDFVGVVGFDVEPFVVVPLTSVERIRGNFDAQVDRLRASGRTYLYPAIVEAKRQLERQSAGHKHVIILSDGETGGSGSDYIDLVGVMRGELKMTVSAVAIGDEANIPLMKRIAQYGGGLFHHTFDPTTLPQIVLQQLQEKPEEGPLVEKPITPVAVRGSELLGSLSERSYPVIRGYTESEIKRGAHLDMMIPRPEKKLPLLASWRYAKGKVVAFTTDLHGRWTREWVQWPQLEKFWARIFEWLLPPKEVLPPHEVRINLEQHRPVLDFYLYAEGDGSLFRYSYSGKGSSGEGILKRLAPGHYQTELPFSIPGEYRIALTEERRGQRISYPSLGYTLPFDPKVEAPHDGFNMALLERLARTTGGEVNPRSVEGLKTQETIRAATSIRSQLIFLVLILFLLEIIFRRFFRYLQFG
jgi:Ca-activated chloride channel homolog